VPLVDLEENAGREVTVVAQEHDEDVSYGYTQQSDHEGMENGLNDGKGPGGETWESKAGHGRKIAPRREHSEPRSGGGSEGRRSETRTYNDTGYKNYARKEKDDSYAKKEKDDRVTSH
jgi:hypothetical protein